MPKGRFETSKYEDSYSNKSHKPLDIHKMNVKKSTSKVEQLQSDLQVGSKYSNGENAVEISKNNYDQKLNSMQQSIDTLQLDIKSLGEQMNQGIANFMQQLLEIKLEFAKLTGDVSPQKLRVQRAAHSIESKSEVSSLPDDQHPQAVLPQNVEERPECSQKKADGYTRIHNINEDNKNFDVFMSHNSRDKRIVKEIAKQLKEQHQILPFLDEWDLRPGQCWHNALEKSIKKSKSMAVFLGRHGLGPWQENEIKAFLTENSRGERPIIPVILPDYQNTPKIHFFIKKYNVDRFS
jgi:hypothetical protein